jgi:TetR/AcrR family transcriptional regulator, cholesterol catabolism regulator
LKQALADSAAKPTLDRLFDTAAALFWEKGYAATTTREIASAVGIQQASLYYHVASKEDLLYQLGVSSLERLQSEVQSALAQIRDPLERIAAFIQVHLTTLLKHQIRHVTVLTELHGLTARHREAVLALRKRYAGLVRALLEEAQRAGAVRADIPARYLYLALLNMLNWAVFWFRQGQSSSIEEVAGFFRTIFLDGSQADRRPVLLHLPDSRRRRTEKSKPPRKTTPERMLDRAAALFSSKGYTATSTREIAAGLGMRKASLYYHIQTKEDLLYVIAKSSLEQIRGDVESALTNTADPLERVRVLISAHIHSLLRDQDKHAAALAEMHLLSPQRRAQVVALRDNYEEMVRSILQRAQAAGVLRADIPAKYLCLGLLGLMNRVVVWHRRKGPLAPAQLADLLTEVFLAGARSSTDRQVKSRRA